MSQERASSKQETQLRPVPWGLVGLSWLIPGIGHLILGRRRRAIVFAATVVLAFITGLLLDGELVLPQHGAPFSWFKSFACFGTGSLFILGRLAGLGIGDPTAVGFPYGGAFLYTAGLMNWLVVLDASDIGRGRKQ